MSTSTFTPNPLALDLVRRGILAGVQEVTQAVESQARAYAPVRTGYLVSTIESTAPEDNGSSVSATVAALAPYAVYVEYGTGMRGAATGGGEGYGSQPGMVAQPYMRPAIDEAANTGPDTIAAAIAEATA